MLGSLTLGGYDASRFDSAQVLNVGFSSDSTRDMMVQIDGITTNMTSKASTLLSDSVSAFVDTTVSDLWLPLTVCQQFEDVLGIIWNSTDKLYYLNSSQAGILTNSNPVVTFTLSDPASQQSMNFVIPYQAFAQNATWPRYSDYPNSIPYFPLRRAANQSQITIGRVLFQEM